MGSNSGSFFVNKAILPDGERLAFLIDSRTGLPEPHSARYSVVLLRNSGAATNSITKVLRAVGLAHAWCADRGIDLAGRIETCDFFTQEETTDLVNYLRINRRKPSRLELQAIRRGKPKQRAANDGDEVRATVDAATSYNRVHDVHDYVTWRAEGVILRIPTSSGKLEAAKSKLEIWSKIILGQVRSGPSKKRYGLKKPLRKRFLSIIHPSSPENPFEPAHRHRNYAILLFYYELGVRRGEGLAVKTRDLRLHGNNPAVYIHRRPDDPEDPRPDQPLAKTADRLLPIGTYLRNVIEDWIVKHRSDRNRYPGAKRTPYIFVAENGRPMALRTIHDLFVRIRTCFSEEFPADLSCHTLRHTWNDRFSELCDEVRDEQAAKAPHSDTRLNHALEMSMRNYLMGWKKNSKRAATYTHRTVESQSEKYSLQLQRKNFDA